MAPTQGPQSGYSSNGRRPEPPGPAPPGMRWHRWSNGRSSGWQLWRERVVADDEEFGGPHALTVASLLGDERDHVPRPHKKGLPVQVCACCMELQGGDGDGLDGSYVPWPCEILAFLRVQRERADVPTVSAILSSLREVERWTSDPRARAACGRLIRTLERGA